MKKGLIFCFFLGNMSVMLKSYFLKRLLLIPVTLFGIMALNFLFVQLAPGGPVEQMMMKLDEVIKRFSSNDMVFENTADYDKLNRAVEGTDKNLIESYKNE